MTSDVKAAPLPRLINVGGVVALLAIDARLEPGQVEEALMQCGVQPVGNDGDGQLVWSDKAVTAAADVIRLACRGREAGVDVALVFPAGFPAGAKYPRCVCRRRSKLFAIPRSIAST